MISSVFGREPAAAHAKKDMLLSMWSLWESATKATHQIASMDSKKARNALYGWSRAGVHPANSLSVQRSFAMLLLMVSVVAMITVLVSRLGSLRSKTPSWCMSKRRWMRAALWFDLSFYLFLAATTFVHEADYWTYVHAKFPAIFESLHIALAVRALVISLLILECLFESTTSAEKYAYFFVFGLYVVVNGLYLCLVLPSLLDARVNALIPLGQSLRSALGILLCIMYLAELNEEGLREGGVFKVWSSWEPNGVPWQACDIVYDDLEKGYGFSSACGEAGARNDSRLLVSCSDDAYSDMIETFERLPERVEIASRRNVGLEFQTDGSGASARASRTREHHRPAKGACSRQQELESRRLLSSRATRQGGPSPGRQLVTTSASLLAEHGSEHDGASSVAASSPRTRRCIDSLHESVEAMACSAGHRKYYCRPSADAAGTADAQARISLV
ncbi:hypothetical protein FVE85_5143 [Porphyridium purpureum]|uniref:Uncharacterized protein n=1 Tax=Porphyridium purpureum TaxID=35688 RepID=A0A5J4Z2R6_PORPP|nr:hypothetical protein FVE85_5143 [Porphyridium purpureum]|eukprot:POR5271..scf295_1